MTNQFLALRRNQRSGSKPRCHLLTDGTREEVAARLTALAAPFGEVLPTDCWMPDGFSDVEEAQLHKASKLLGPDIRESLLRWWLAKGGSEKTTPNFDIASTCNIERENGLLLIEAKAHHDELSNETAGRRLERKKKGRDLTENEIAEQAMNHATIGEAISTACEGFCQATSLDWKISRDVHYQMSNRFAWAWKLCELGNPVILIYLGFLQAEEMRPKGETPFASNYDWISAVKTHSDPLFPFQVWGKRLVCNGRSFIPLIKSLTVPLQERPNAETNRGT